MKRHYIAACLSFSVFVLLLGKFYLEQNVAPSANRRPNSISKNEVGYKGKALKQFSFGFDNLFASLIWIELLQKANVTPVEKGKLSWEFMQLDSITDLDPAFERAYGFGAPFISTLRRDATGGKILLEKWVRRRPDNWRTHYTLGVHLFFEFRNYAEAAPLILKAASLSGAPQWLNSLGVRLLSESGSYLHALKTATTLYPDVRDDEGRSRLKIRMRSLNFLIQRSAWKEALNQYRNKRKRAPSSTEDLKNEMRMQIRELSSVIGDGKVPEELVPILRESFSFHYNKDSNTIESDVPLEKLGVERPGIYHEGT